MSWNRADRMSERVKFIAAYLEYEASSIDLCRDFGIRRKTGFKWVRRYEADAHALAGSSDGGREGTRYLHQAPPRPPIG